MKKYAAAGAAAVMVFGVTAFAATFTVDDSVLATGTGDVDNCTENVEVISYGLDSATGAISNVSVGLDEACYAIAAATPTVMFASFEDEDGNQLRRSVETRIPAAEASNGRLTLNVNGAPLASELIEGIRFSIHTKTDA